MNYDDWLAGWLAENTIGEINPVNKNKNRWHFLLLKITIFPL